jgi:hypothetical protein
VSITNYRNLKLLNGETWHMRNILVILGLLILLMVGCTQTPAPLLQQKSAIPRTESPAPSEQIPPTPPAEIMPPNSQTIIQSNIEKPTSYESERYTNKDNGFSIRYPKTWNSQKPPLSTNVFLASAVQNQPDKLAVIIDVRKADNLKNASRDLVYELINWKTSFAPPKDTFYTIYENSHEIGSSKLTSYDVCWAVANYRIYCYSALRNGKAIMTIAGWDENQSDLYKEIIHTLNFE